MYERLQFNVLVDYLSGFSTEVNSECVLHAVFHSAAMVCTLDNNSALLVQSQLTLLRLLGSNKGAVRERS